MAVTVLSREKHKSIYRIVTVGVGEGGLEDAYAEAHDHETGGVLSSGEMDNTFYEVLEVQSFRIKRNFFHFDTSGVGTVEVEAARLWVSIGKSEADTDHSDIYLMPGTQTIPNPVSADYGTHAGDDPYLGVLRYEDMVNYPNLIVFNEAGRNWINTSGNTLFCSRLRGDVKAWMPTGFNTGYFSSTGYFLDKVITDAATDIGAGIATLNGTFQVLRGPPPYLEITHDGNNPIYPRFRFVWGVGNAFDQTTDWQYGKLLGEAFSVNLTGLSPAYYRFKAVYEDAEGQELGDAEAFTIEIGYPIVYPNGGDGTVTRVSSLIHRWVPGSYTLEMVLGGVTSEFGLIIPTGKPTPTIPTLPSCQSDEVLTWSLEQGYFCMKISDIPPGKY